MTDDDLKELVNKISSSLENTDRLQKEYHAAITEAENKRWEMYLQLETLTTPYQFRDCLNSSLVPRTPRLQSWEVQTLDEVENYFKEMVDEFTVKQFLKSQRQIDKTE